MSKSNIPNAILFEVAFKALDDCILKLEDFAFHPGGTDDKLSAREEKYKDRLIHLCKIMYEDYYDESNARHRNWIS